MILTVPEKEALTSHTRSKVPLNCSASRSSEHWVSICWRGNVFKYSIFSRASMVAMVIMLPAVLLRVVDSTILPTARNPIAKMAMAMRTSIMVRPLLFFVNKCFFRYGVISMRCGYSVLIRPVLLTMIFFTIPFEFTK